MGAIDYQGQYLNEKLYQGIQILFAVIGVLYGFYTTFFIHTLAIFAVGLIVSAIVCVPAWPFYKQNQLKWLNTVMVPAKQEPKANNSRFI
jgi:signal peptidase complex subunit 1